MEVIVFCCKPRIFLLLFLSTVSSCLLFSHPFGDNDKYAIARISSYVDSLVAEDEFSGVVLVSKKGEVLFQKAYGMAIKETSTPNRVDTKFNLGSINKVFTQIAIHQLVRQGRMQLTDPIKKFLPDYPNQEAAENVTIQHLLTMTSGIGDFFGDRYRATPKESLRTISDYLALFADKPLEFEPGKGSRYSNGGYIVLGAIIEASTGIDYYEYVRKNVFQPAMMRETDWYFKSQKVANLAAGYMGTKGRRVRNDETRPERGSSAGGGYSTAGDLWKFTRALKDGVLYHPRVEKDGGLGTAGGAPGINAALEWDSRSDILVVILTNYDPPSAEKPARTIFQWLAKAEDGKKDP